MKMTKFVNLRFSVSVNFDDYYMFFPQDGELFILIVLFFSLAGETIKTYYLPIIVLPGIIGNILSFLVRLRQGPMEIFLGLCNTGLFTNKLIN